MIKLRYLLFWDFTQRIFVVTDVSGQPIGPIFKDQTIEYQRVTDGLNRQAPSTNDCDISTYFHLGGIY
jgi:hypothetical protein